MNISLLTRYSNILIFGNQFAHVSRKLGLRNISTSLIIQKSNAYRENRIFPIKITSASFRKDQYRRHASTIRQIQNCGNDNKRKKFNEEDDYKTFAGYTAATMVASLGFYWVWTKSKEFMIVEAATLETKSSTVISGLPEYKMSQVAEHYSPEKRIWVSFNRGIYDVTEFVEKHPGGNRIMMAAGGSLEPFWELYPVHQRADVFEILEKYRIGNLAKEDIVVQSENEFDHFSKDPRRHPALIPRSKKPFNGETPPSILTEKFYTPNDLFYVRNHLPVPETDAKTYQLEIEGINLKKSKTFSFNDLKKFSKVEVSATIQCGGNRRSEMGKSKPVAGLAWTGGAIGNAKWAGTRLRDVLKAAGFRIESYPHPEKIHVQFEGMDSDQSGECYGSSIPLSYILDENFEAVLAYEMNGKALPVDHGFPIRIILPGIVGARSVKWLSRIIISDQESQSLWQQRDYKVFSPSVTMETVDFSSAPAIMDTPVTSYICSHENGQSLPKGQATFQGYAFSGGGRSIVRIETSVDRGKTWQIGKIQHKPADGTRSWDWVLWEATVDFSKVKGEQEIWVKAVDSGYNQQVEDSSNIWNYRGLLNNAYHKMSFIIS